MSKSIPVSDMAAMYSLPEDMLRRYAEEGRIPSHRHHETREVLFVDSDMFRIDREELLATGNVPPAGEFSPSPSAWTTEGPMG